MHACGLTAWCVTNGLFTSSTFYFFIQDGSSILFGAAFAGSLAIFEWLMEMFSLDPDQWNEVSSCVLTPIQ